MLIVEVKNGKIEQALKALKRKVRDTKQNQELRDRKEHIKDSVSNRQEKNNAIYKEIKDNDESI